MPPRRPDRVRVDGIRDVLVERKPKRNTPVLSRSAAFSAADILTLYRIDRSSRVLLVMCWQQPKNIVLQALFVKLRRLRFELCQPMWIERTLFAPKNRSIARLEWGDDMLRELFVFNNRAQLHAVFTSLRAPAYLKLPGVRTGYVETEFAFLLYVYRFRNNSKLTLMTTVFGAEYSVISRALSAFGAWLYDAHSHRLTDSMHFWSQHVITYCSKIRASGLPPAYDRVWGFVDGTLIACGRPSDVALVSYPPPPADAPVVWDVAAEALFYCKYEMAHGLKFQACVAPCGFIMDLTGCAFGSFHDSRLLTDSKLLLRLLEMHGMDLGLMRTDQYYHLLADSAYASGPFVRRVPGGRSRDAARCAAVRVAVEHAFAKLYQKFPTLDWSTNKHLFGGQSVIESVYNIALLCNIDTSLNGSQIGNYFNCACPTLQDYMTFARR